MDSRLRGSLLSIQIRFSLIADSAAERKSGMATPAACNSISIEAVRMELEQVLKSRVFSQSIRLCRFLRFTVEYTIAGKADLLKEYLIGCEVYDRKPPYDPTQDSIVRTEARRLRSKLKLYYETEGRHNQVRIHFDVGRYVPSFISQPSIHERGVLDYADDTRLAVEANKVLIGVEPFRDLARTTLSAAFADGLSEEIANVLMRRGMCSVLAGRSRQGADSLPSWEPLPLCPDFRLEGSIREAEGGLSVMVKLIRAHQLQVA